MTVFLDCTSSCKSPLNTGVQRVVRSLHAALVRRAAAADGTAVTPLIWSDRERAYCRLGRRERGFLERPFARRPAAAAEPEFAANPWPWSKLLRALGHRRRRVDLAGLLRAGDVLLVPEIFQDRRTEFLPSLRGQTAARREALFYDAITWRRPDLSPPRRLDGFFAYLRALGCLGRVTADSAEAAGDLEAWWDEHGVPDAPRPVPARALGVDGLGGALRPPPSPPPPGRPTLLCVATLEARKNHLALLAAAEALWAGGLDFALVLVGRTTRHWGANVLAPLDRLRAAGRPVEWRRHVDDAALAGAYAQARATVFPSLIEGFGLPLYESLWHGRPCVCGNTGAIAEAAAGGGCLPCDARDPAALAGAMRAILGDDALHARLCAEARARVFPTWDGYAAELWASWAA